MVNPPSPKPLALIIEDDDKLVTIYTQALKIAEFDTQYVCDGDAALELLDTIRPAIVLLDLHLPGTAGDKVLARIRRDERLKGTQVILATADQLMADMLIEQSDFVLEKPVSFGQLRDLAVRLRSTLN
jgi:DNA-binding response OmpR family regulator